MDNLSKVTDRKLIVTKENKSKEKTFTSFEEAKQHLKTTGLNDKEIKEIEQKLQKGDKEMVFNKTSFDLKIYHSFKN